jgi:hypothetical protein
VVAVKTILSGIMDGSATEQMLLHEASLASRIHRLLSETPIPPSEWVENYPPALEQIVLKALNKPTRARFADARELFEALAQAVPQAFQPGFESEVAHYLEELLGDRCAESKARLRVAQQVLDVAKEPTVASSEPNPASAASLRALVVDAAAPATKASSAAQTHITLASGGVDELRPGRASRDRARLKWLLSAIVVLAVAGSFSVRSRFAAVRRMRRKRPRPSPREPASYYLHDFRSREAPEHDRRLRHPPCRTFKSRRRKRLQARRVDPRCAPDSLRR